MTVRQLKSHESDKANGHGPWYVDRADVIAFRTLGTCTDTIQVVLRSGDSIYVRDCPETMEFLLERNSP